jgi:hypothetical protein
MLVSGMLLFLSSYGVYAFFLGGIDGLQPLGAEMFPPDGNPIIDPPVQESLREEMIRKAFGPGCQELTRPIRLLVRDKGMVLSAGQFTIDDDGRVKFSPFSAAIFPKNKDGGYPEINTVQSDFAFLTLDKRVQTPAELANRKVTAIELRGGGGIGIKITNNRRTPETSDDLEVYVSLSPLFYEERRNLIWADGLVRLLDLQSKPEPTKITARGMKMLLSPDSGPNKPKAAKAQGKGNNDAISNIELLTLLSDVEMHLFVDNSDGFLGAAETPARPAADPKSVADNKKAPDKSHIFIKTSGTFTYDVPKDLAWFDGPPFHKGGAVPNRPEQVLVSRLHPGQKYDQLYCDHLKLQFRKKAPPPGQKKGAADSQTGNKEIETAIATARPGQIVTLTMDTENLEAYGNELHYYAAEPGRGPKTILKGSPMRAVKDGHKITARELQLTGADQAGNGKSAFGKGSGQIDLLDKASTEPKYSTHITWKDTLVSTMERDGDKLYERWTITGDAVYVDEDQKQELRGQTIQLWLDSGDPARGGPKSSGGPKQRPDKIEAFDGVTARAQDTIIKHADHLLIIFRPEVASGAMLPEIPVPPTQAVPTQPAPPKIDPPIIGARASRPGDTPAITIPGPAPAAPAAPAGPPAPKKEEPRKPIFLDAKDVVIYVATLGGKKQLEKLDASGRVHVVQDPEKAGEKGMDITGDLLTLVRDVSGDYILTVFGDTRNPRDMRSLARLEMNETIVWGPKVTIDQVRNHADVDGQGAMSMPSKTSVDGDKPARPGARMMIHWNKYMTFDGTNANFHGGVIGEQDESRIQCESMQAIMDKPVIFKESQKPGQGAKVDRLMCNTKVFASDEQRDPSGKRIQANILEATVLNVDNARGPTKASGPGRFRHLGLSDSDPAAPAGGVKAQPPKTVKREREMTLTHIEFKGMMFSNTKDTKKFAKFYDSVEVFNIPSEIFEVPLDPDKLPKNGFYLKCETLEVQSRKVGDRTIQAMAAKDQVYFRNPELFGRCDVLTFDEATDTIIFTANPGGQVDLNQRQGNSTKHITGEKVTYNRKTGAITVGGAGVMQSSWLEAPRVPVGEFAPAINPAGTAARAPRG